MNEYVKCKISDDGRHVEPCKILGECMEYGNPTPRGKGLFLPVYHNRKEGTSRSFVIFKGGDHIKNGMAINHCPFCGEDITAPFMKSE